MEVAAAKQLHPTMPPPRDPTSPSSSTSSSSPSSAAASPSSRQQQQQSPLPPSPRPVTPRVIDTTPFPTTFVQADTASFKQVVQMLTGPAHAPPAHQKPATSKNHHGAPCRPKKPAFKLYERRSGHKNLKTIAPLAMAAAGPSPRNVTTPEALFPSVLDFPSLTLESPVTPLVADPFHRSPVPSTSPGEDERSAERAAIARTGFFLHPSPRSTEPPTLLPLFPVTSPRMASAAAAPASQ